MTSFVVLSHDGLLGERAGERTVFVRDAFSYIAFFAPVFWLLWYRLWFHAVIVLCVTMLIFSLAQTQLNPMVILPLNLLIGLLVSMEGPAWRISAHKRGTYREIGVVEADVMEDAQLIWGIECDELPTAPQKPASSAKGTLDLFFSGGN